MICWSDLPRIQVEYVNYLVNHFQQSVIRNHQSIIMPTFQCQRGHPLIFYSDYQSDIFAHCAPNGCQGIIKRYSQHVLEVQMDSDRCLKGLKDIDAWSDYQNLS